MLRISRGEYRTFDMVGAAILTVAVSACSGQISNSAAGNSAHSGIMYPITPAEADTVISTSMALVFPDRHQTRISNSVIGYSVTIDFALDRHRFSAIAIPATGIDDRGIRVPGYQFEVAHDGTMMIQGPPRATSLFERINSMASAIRTPLQIQ